MDASELARKMLEWQEVQAKADLLKMDIEAAVLELGKTQTVGNVRASYSAGRKSYDYEGAAQAYPNQVNVVLSSFTKTVRTVDWRGICQHIGIKTIPFTQSAPSVSLKIIE